MRARSKPSQILAALAISAFSTGCELAPKPDVPVQPVSIKADTFCPVMRRLNPPDGIPTWDVTDTKETIEYNRQLEAAVRAKCLTTSKVRAARVVP